MRIIKIFVVFGIAMASIFAHATDAFYSVSSKEQGMPFDLVVTEAKREPSKSFLSIPGFHKRSAAASRWLMCAYTDLAIRRGFKYWIAVYPDESNETIVIGLYQSENADVPGTLGSDYVASRAMPPKPASAELIRAKLCGMRQ